MRETINKASCPNCGMATTSRDAAMSTEEQQLRIENAKLKAEVSIKVKGKAFSTYICLDTRFTFMSVKKAWDLHYVSSVRY